MTTWIKVARFHLVDRFSYTAMPWAILAIAFVINLTIADAERGGGSAQIATGAVAAIYVFFFALGILNIGQSLPFAFALGVSRHSYYAGTVMLAVSLAAVYGLALALLQVIEQASGGWGVGLHFFRVGYILPGPWYLTWLTSFVLLALMFVCGMWVGLICRPWVSSSPPSARPGGPACSPHSPLSWSQAATPPCATSPSDPDVTSGESNANRRYPDER